MKPQQTPPKEAETSAEAPEAAPSSSQEGTAAAPPATPPPGEAPEAAEPAAAAAEPAAEVAEPADPEAPVSEAPVPAPSSPASSEGARRAAGARSNGRPRSGRAPARKGPIKKDARRDGKKEPKREAKKDGPDFSIYSPKVQALSAKAGISLEAALAVSQGLTTLERALANQRSRRELSVLVHKHKLPHSLAGQVLKQQMSIEEAQLRARVIAYRRAHSSVCSFTEGQKSGDSLVLGLHGHRVVRTPILENLKYDIKIRVEEAEQVVPKHEVKYLYRPRAEKAIFKALKVDKALAEAKAGPIIKIAQRFRLRDDQLQRVLDQQGHLNVTLLEGEKFSAELKRYSEYEVVLGFRGENELVILRHALKECSPVPIEEVLAAERYAKKMQKKLSAKKKKKRR